MTTLGVDPGRSGGAGLVRGRVVHDWWAWTVTKKGIRFRQAKREPLLLSSLHDVGAFIAYSLPHCSVVLEGLFVARGNSKAQKGKRRSGMNLAEATGEILGPLRALDPNPLRPTADKWRGKVLGIKGMGAAYCEERAVAFVTEQLRWAPGVAERFGTLTLAEEGAVCEGICMGIFGEEGE